MSRLKFAAWLALALAVFPSSVLGQVLAPDYQDCRLESIFPAGGQRGRSVTVALSGFKAGSLAGALDVLVDGPPGIAVRDVKNGSGTTVQATFDIAADAPLGRRCVRVLCERSGLTNMLYFMVGRHPEIREKEPNNEVASAQLVTLPVVVNGQVDPMADIDGYRFSLKKGQRLVAMVMAHALDIHGHRANFGIVDSRLELLDARGNLLAEAGDTLGLDPQIEYLARADGDYLVRIHLEGLAGFPHAVYRLLLGEPALATSVFPPGGRRGTEVVVDFDGPGVPAGTRRKISVPTGISPFQHIVPEGDGFADLDLPFVHGDIPERLEVEPNQRADQATPLQVPMTVNARFGAAADVDWYRVRLAAKQKISLETTAQRFLRSSLDTLIEVLDASGKKLAENDDGFAIDYVSMHDFRPMDSRLVFTAPVAGDYFVRVSDQAGSFGPRAVYRLTVTEAEPDFELYLTPDGVPIWGPGSTAALLVKVQRLNDLGGDIALTVEGLPPGWKAEPSVSRGPGSTPSQDAFRYHFLTITAPADAKVGQSFPFRVVGRADVAGRSIERVAQPLTLYYSSDVGFFRIVPTARVAVAKAQTPWLSTDADTFHAGPGGAVSIPVRVHGAEKLDRIDLTANLAMNGVSTAIDVPQTVPVKGGLAMLPLRLGPQMKPGRYAIAVSLRWRSDVRIGMPGPSTKLLTLEVTPAGK